MNKGSNNNLRERERAQESAGVGQGAEEFNQGARGGVQAGHMRAEADNNNGAVVQYGTDWFWVTFSDEGARTFQVSEDVNNNIPDNNWN